MSGFETFLQACLKRKLSAAHWEHFAECFEGKTGAERDEIALRLAKEIEETCPPREAQEEPRREAD